ncbi:ssDNA-binding protein [Leisingera sp. NJS204]|uniref:ssDNA-binding protein n=1 Tax=Leisingera sp. NJS204 TaxID=2508307 RepID=UPI001011E5CF|nr:ssDNA-binding protein [Leisingera sp. NJS204]QAX31293.1 DUF2815 family protein [Leisingera sp. NJS204]
MSDFIMISGARVSFPHLFTPPTINGEEGKCGATLMLDPKDHAKVIGQIEDQIAELCKFKFKGRKLAAEKLCLRAGEDKGRAEYDGLMVLSANCKNRPLVLRGDGRTRIEDERDSPIYAGCVVNAKVRLWAQDNQYGKRVNAELVAIQFLRDGEPLDGSYVSEDEAADGFGEVASDDDFLAA